MFPLSIKENLVSDASVAYVESRARISFLMFCPIPPVWNCTTQLSVLLVASATWWGTCRFGRLKGLRKIEEQHRFCPQSQIWSIFVTWSIMNVTPKLPTCSKRHRTYGGYSSIPHNSWTTRTLLWFASSGVPLGKHKFQIEFSLSYRMINVLSTWYGVAHAGGETAKEGLGWFRKYIDK